MLSSKWNLFGAAGLVIVLAAHSTSWGQLPAPPTAPSAAAPAATSAPQFRALTDADIQAGLAEVKAAAAAVDARFALAGASAQGWKDYLAWTAFQGELQKAKPDKAVLSSAYNNLASGAEGLELKSFADLRTVLGNYLAIADSVGSADLAAAVKGQIDDFTTELKALGPNPTTEQTRKIADHLLWLEMARQTPELAKSARDRFSAPNFQVHVGKELLDLGVGGPIDEVAPVDDVILGTTIHGTGRTVGQTQARLSPDPRFATFDAYLEAVNHSNSVGHNGPVCIYATGETGLAALKRFWIDDTGIHVYPTAASAQTSTTINNIVSIKGRKFVEKIAWKRAGKQKGEAEAIAGQHASGRLRARVDSQADAPVLDANGRFDAKVRKPLTERRAYPRLLKFSTVASGLDINGISGTEAQLAAPSAPPALTQPADLTVCIHESMLNNLAENIFTGMHLNDEMAQRTALQLTGSVPDKLKPEANQEPFTIIFPPERIPRVDPITVTFADNGYSVTLRGQEYFTGDRRQPGMNITANYKFVKTPEGYKGVRQGDLEIYGFGQKPGTKRSLRQQGIYTALQAKFGKIFEPEIKFQGIKFAQGKLANAGQFVPQEIISQNGWLAIGYARAKPAGVTAANN